MSQRNVRLLATAAITGVLLATTGSIAQEPTKMQEQQMNRNVKAEHSILYRAPQESPLCYFGWPTVAKLDDGRLIAGASGFRAGHICPFGVTVLWESSDEGRTWSAPSILNNSIADDRDAGITALADGAYLVSWFISDIRRYREHLAPYWNVLDAWDDEAVKRTTGSYVRRVNADGSAEQPVRVLASAPHGPIRRADGSLFYLGSRFGLENADGSLDFSQNNWSLSSLAVLESRDEGATWQTVNILNESPEEKFCEPHALELPNGRILGALRSDRNFSTWIFYTDDGGKTWSKPVKVIDSGSPPHLMLHSSGTIVLTFGYRLPPFGQRAIFSTDGGESWSDEWVIRDDGPSGDLGYPSTVELSDGKLYSIYYQQVVGDQACSILASHWELPQL